MVVKVGIAPCRQRVGSTAMLTEDQYKVIVNHARIFVLLADPLT